MDQVTLRAEVGREIGTRPSRRLRRTGQVPAVVYGRDIDTTSVAVNYRDLRAALTTEAGLNALINLDVDGDSVLTVAREIQRHPVRGEIVHLDFVKISLTEAIEAEVTLEFEGVPIGVTRDAGIVETIRNSVLVEALPTDIPSSITLDISELEIGDTLTVSDLAAIEGVTYLDDEESTLVLVGAPRLEEEEEEVEEIEGLEEGVEEGEGEAAESEAADEEQG